MLRTPFASERLQRIDPRTGIKVIQITSYPTPSAHFLYDWPSITRDNSRLLLWSQRAAVRNAPWDLFRCDVDGLNLFQITERGDVMEVGGYYGRPAACMSLDGTTVWGVWGSVLCRVDVETGDLEELMSLEDVFDEGCVPGRMLISSSGERLFIAMSGTRSYPVRVDLTKGIADAMDINGTFFACVHDEPRIVIQQGQIVWGTEQNEKGDRKVINAGDQLSLWSMDEDGSDRRYICPQMFAHATVLGGGGKLTIQGPGLPPHRCIWLATEGEEPRKLCQGPYFWHSGSSYDGQWIVSDTNWPDEGLQYIHVPTGNFRTLCHPGASEDHYEFGHPHPHISQDGRVVVFRSDRSGMSQIYVARVTDEFRESVIAGELDQPRDKWM